MQEYKYMNLTQLGKLFGMTSHEMGKVLVEIGLRTHEKKPSYKALDGGFVTTTENGRGTGWYYVWDRAKTIAALEAAGHKQILPAPGGDLAAGGLHGPFELRSNGSNCAEIVNGDGTVGIWVVETAEAHRLLEVMNLAHRHGALG